MIVTKLCGGLGNQIFQWAAAQSVAEKYDTDVYCCLQYFEKNGSKDAEKLPCGSVKTNLQRNGPTPWGYELDKLDLNLNLVSGNVFNLPVVHDTWTVKRLQNNSYLEGYWQSEKYFIENADRIRSLLKMSDEKLKQIQQLYPFLSNGTLSLHVRRGDYTNLQHVHPCQTVEYYNKALDIIQDFSNILVFSDDINWCRENLKYDNVYFAEGQDNITDLYTMSLCSHNVIANSTFSWWGAWLNANPYKKVVAPRLWAANIPTEKVTPESWVII